MFNNYYEQKIVALKKRKEVLQDRINSSDEGNEKHQAAKELKAVKVELENYIGAMK